MLDWKSKGEVMGFDEYWEERAIMDYLRPLAEHAWDAATAEAWKNPPEGWYQLGEEVCACGKHSATIVALDESNQNWTACPAKVRRKPAWEPKDGEAVLAKSKSGKAFYTVSAGGIDIYDNSEPVSGILEAYDIKPWKPDCQGKPWGEV
jgi:hypothetical protein